MKKSCPGKGGHPPSLVNFSECFMYINNNNDDNNNNNNNNNKVVPFARASNTCACSNCRGKDSLVTTTLRRQLAQNFVSLNSPMMQFHTTSTQSPRKLKIVNRGHLVRLMNAKALGIVQRDR